MKHIAFDTNRSQELKEYIYESSSLEGDWFIMYSFARRIVWCPWIAGFAEESVDEGVLAQHPETRCIIYELEVNNNNYM